MSGFLRMIAPYILTGMKELTARWKIFRFICFLQMIAVALQLLFSVGGLFLARIFLLSFFASIIYGFILVFLYQAISILNYNYPDTSISPRQKKYFNILYLFNFLFITFLFAQVINSWRTTITLLHLFTGHFIYYVLIIFELMMMLFIFLTHLYFLINMYALRRLIHKNSEETWEQQFSESEN